MGFPQVDETDDAVYRETYADDTAPKVTTAATKDVAALKETMMFVDH
jgi:hypothetical protein